MVATGKAVTEGGLHYTRFQFHLSRRCLPACCVAVMAPRCSSESRKRLRRRRRRPFENLAFPLFQILPTRETNLFFCWSGHVCRCPSCFWRCTASGSSGLSCTSTMQEGNCHLRLTCFRYACVSSPAADFDRRLLVIGYAISFGRSLFFLSSRSIYGRASQTRLKRPGVRPGH